MICPISSHLSLSRPQLYDHLRTPSKFIPLYLSMPWSRVNTEYSIHRVQHTPSTAYTEYSIHRVQHTPSTAYTDYCIHQVQHHPKIDSLLLAATFSSLGGCCTQLSTFPQLQVNQCIETQLPSRLPPNRPPPSTPPNSLHHRLQDHLQTCSVTASECIWKLDRPPSSSSEFTRSRPPSASPNSLNHGLHVHLWVHAMSASKCISKLTRSRPPNASPNSIEHGLQVYR